MKRIAWMPAFMIVLLLAAGRVWAAGVYCKMISTKYASGSKSTHYAEPSECQCDRHEEQKKGYLNCPKLKRSSNDADSSLQAPGSSSFKFNNEHWFQFWDDGGIFGSSGEKYCSKQKTKYDEFLKKEKEEKDEGSGVNHDV